jgi:hypothetical protein
MLLDVLSKYLREVEARLRKVQGAYVERYENEITSKELAEASSSVVAIGSNVVASCKIPFLTQFYVL